MLLPADPTFAFMPYPAVAVPNAPDGPLAGLTLGVKDIFDVAGYRTGCGSPTKLAESEVKTVHNSAVAALLNAGARFVGKTHTEELAWSLYGTNVHFGTPINPAAPGRIPGGSSSGSASAVAAGTCDIALGSDTGGSVRGPASFCGLYGLRPSHGAVGLDHCMPLAPSFDTCGWFARDAATMARVGDVLLPADRATATRPLLAQDLFARLAPEVRAALEPAISRISARAGQPAPVTIYPGPVEPLYSAFRNVQAVEALAEHGAWVERTRPSLGPHIAPRITLARAVTAAEAASGKALRAAFAAGLQALLGGDGLLIAPTVPGPAPKLGGDAEEAEAYRYGAMLLLMPAGLAGLPQLVIPAGMVHGAPVGLSLIGPPGSDRALLSLAAAL